MQTEAERWDAWRRHENTANRVIPYATLGISTLLALVVPAPGQQPAALLLGVCAVAVGWCAWLGRSVVTAAERPGRMTGYLTGLLVLAAVLVLVSPWYGFFAWTGYPLSFSLRGRRIIAGVAATAVISATAQGGGLPDSAQHLLLWALVVLFNLVLAGAVGWFGVVNARQSEGRKVMIDELAEANGRLEAALRENEGLHAQLLTQAREAGVLDERQRLAREIHDTIAQGLAGIITQLEAAEQTRDRRGEWQRHVDTALDLARESLTEARRSVRAIGPAQLDQGRLPEVLADLVEQWSARHGVPARITTTGTVQPMHPEIEVTLLRTAQEALTNVAKHAGATRVGLTLSYMPDQVTLDVRDDGRGGAAGTAGNGDGGFGLVAMRQRIDRVAGRLEIESEPGGGTAISASVPALAISIPEPAHPTSDPEPAHAVSDPAHAASVAEPAHAASVAEPAHAASAAEPAHPASAAVATGAGGAA
ncbi:sensor histidine kinase [Plantactinospora siamensis]|uniref:Sensor histidine kinase n=1 Tax=Plantactinospora siamensis TaxID=555372 RepID=A0ABV6P5W1_9ACTN